MLQSGKLRSHAPCRRHKAAPFFIWILGFWNLGTAFCPLGVFWGSQIKHNTWPRFIACPPHVSFQEVLGGTTLSTTPERVQQKGTQGPHLSTLQIERSCCWVLAVYLSEHQSNFLDITPILIFALLPGLITNLQPLITFCEINISSSL